MQTINAYIFTIASTPYQRVEADIPVLSPVCRRLYYLAPATPVPAQVSEQQGSCRWLLSGAGNTVPFTQRCSQSESPVSDDALCIRPDKEERRKWIKRDHNANRIQLH